MKTYDDLLHLLDRVQINEKIAKRRAYVYSFVPVLLAIVLLGYFVVQINRWQRQLDDLRDKVKQLQTYNDELKNKVSSLQNIYDMKYNAENDFGWSEKDVLNPSPEKILQSLLAHDEMIKLITAKKVDVNITIRYYTKIKDEGKIEATLRKCGYRKIMVNKDSYRSENPTNAIHYSQNIDVENVKVIAYSLIRAGIDIKKIAPYPEQTQAMKPNSIEISGDKDAMMSKTVRLEDIITAKKFE